METYRHVSQIINTNLNHTKGLLAPENTPYALPFTFLRGAKPGPSLVVTGGLHSGEYPGVAACARLSQTLSPEDLAGSVLLLHCVNETGFFAHSEALVPEGNVNLNGDFPGDLSGTPGKRLVAFMEQEIMPFADYILDLHSGGGMEPLSPCLFFPVTAGENVLRTSLKMAAATGIEHLVASSAKTGFYSFAAQHGVPGLLLERGYGAMCREEDVSNYCTDVRGVLKAVNMLPGEPENTDKKTVWPKVDYLVAEHKGLWYPTVKKGDILPAGALWAKSATSGITPSASTAPCTQAACYTTTPAFRCAPETALPPVRTRKKLLYWKTWKPPCSGFSRKNKHKEV